MTRKTSDMIDENLSLFLRHLRMRMEALNKLDIPASNRHFLKAEEKAALLIASNAGRQAVEKLLQHPTVHIRLSAAEHVINWAPQTVIPLLGQLLDADLSAIGSADERLDIRVRTKDALYAHFHIRSSDRNDLIEPLRAYGVHLPYRDYSKWQ